MADSVASTEAQEAARTGFWVLTLGSIGVVFGDIGTSPLYAFREAVAAAAQGQPITRVIVLGVLSLILSRPVWNAAVAGPFVYRDVPIANDAADYFQIPTGRVVEVGTQVTI